LRITTVSSSEIFWSATLRRPVLLHEHIEACLTRAGIGDDELVALRRIARGLPQRLAERQRLRILGEARIRGE
jgi:hypothetical protein